MLNYFEALKTTIQRGEYLLDEMETRVERCWIDTRITMEQRDELLALAAECARDEYQVDLLAMYADHDARIYALEHPLAAGAGHEEGRDCPLRRDRRWRA